MDRPAADAFHDRVARLFQPEPALDRRSVGGGELDGVVEPEKVRRVQEVDVQRVALDPLAAIQEPTQVRDLLRHGDTARVLDGLARRHLVGDRADAADPGGDIGRLLVAAPAEERLEEPWRLEDLELNRFELAVCHPHVQGSFALDAGKSVDVDRPYLGGPIRHVGAPPLRKRGLRR